MNSWSDISRANNAAILAWASDQPWARDMSRCQQDPNWHAEGDVWTHTKLVYAQLELLEEWANLSRSTQLQLLFAALFHDSGKPATTALDPESGRLRSPNHSIVGMHLARQILQEMGCDLRTREEIVALVRYHGRPPYLVTKENPEHEVISLSWLADNRLLYLLALADSRGRIARQTARTEDDLHLWKLLGEENNCFDRPYPFVNDHARFLFYRDKLSSLHYTPHEEYRCKVTMMSGLPGAGKDTWLLTHRSELPVVSLDAVRADLDIDASDNQGTVIQTAREQCRQHLRGHRDFAFNATNTTRLMRQRWVELFADYNARIEIIYIEPPLRTVLEQNKQRTEPVPGWVIARLASKLEPPTYAEAHELNLREF